LFFHILYLFKIKKKKINIKKMLKFSKGNYKNIYSTQVKNINKSTNLNQEIKKLEEQTYNIKINK
tara:strand:- start:1776 stop:1970 length:195 start_codon:yes stop_codon:yes gene_type:complete